MRHADRASLSPSLWLLLCCAGCATGGTTELADLRAENERLQAEIERLRAAQSNGEVVLAAIPSFKVGVAAAEQDFDANAFEQLLETSLQEAAHDPGIAVALETDERETDKVRAMLLHQYLAGEEVPIRITNLTFALQDREHDFKIGGRIVPHDANGTPGAGEARVLVHEGPIDTVMESRGEDRYAITFEESGGRSGEIEIAIGDRDVLATEDTPRAERRGDISFNWQVKLGNFAVYRVEGFRGDLGAFLERMRYPGQDSEIGRYQTTRDLLFLLGYGSFESGLIDQIRTPRAITAVEIASIDQETFAALRGPIAEEELVERVGTARWTACEYVDFEGNQKVWSRPTSVPLPFVSRQVSDRGRVFYVKFGSDGSDVLLGDYPR